MGRFLPLLRILGCGCSWHSWTSFRSKRQLRESDMCRYPVERGPAPLHSAPKRDRVARSC